ncbi:MAG: hypothetical protein QNJ16_05445 [Rhodobacter sp.]|nr:hypothetical protein [Rhodobacter sp.]
MANRPVAELEFLPDGCPDCGRRRVLLPSDPVVVPDDFDWSVRDFEGFRRVMLEDLAAADPERQRWTEADVETVLVEVLAAGLDRASHALDTVFAERFVATARMPRSLVLLLKLIDGIDPAFAAVGAELTSQEIKKYGYDGSVAAIDALEAALTARPQLMDVARVAGLSDLTSIISFITLDDLADFLDGCPLIAHVHPRWRMESGFGVYEVVTLLTEPPRRLHDQVSEFDAADALIAWAIAERDRAVPPDQAEHPMLLLDETTLPDFTLRSVISRIVTPLLPIGTSLRLVDGIRVGVFIRLCVHIQPRFYRSEVEAAVRQVLSTAAGQLFDPANYGFGDVLYLSDVQEALMAVPGVEGVLINRLQIAGRPGSDATASGILRPGSQEALTLDPDNPSSETGYVVLELRGGQVG